MLICRSNYRIPIHYCTPEAASFEERGISIHVQIGGWVFCNLANYGSQPGPYWWAKQRVLLLDGWQSFNNKRNLTSIFLNRYLLYINNNNKWCFCYAPIIFWYLTKHHKISLLFMSWYIHIVSANRPSLQPECWIAKGTAQWDWLNSFERCLWLPPNGHEWSRSTAAKPDVFDLGKGQATTPGTPCPTPYE